ncbi:MAG: hypothetical protein ACR2FN_15175 [Chitinophagaceae bacterium]
MLTIENFEAPVSATIALLKQSKINVTGKTVNETLQYHPDYPSLLSISDSLKQWHVENAAVKITADQVHEVPVLTHYFSNGGIIFNYQIQT